MRVRSCWSGANAEALEVEQPEAAQREVVLPIVGARPFVEEQSFEVEQSLEAEPL